MPLHPYSTDVTRPRKALLVLAVGAILLAWGFGQVLSMLHVTAPWWLDTPAVFGFFGLLWQLYDRFLWCLGPAGSTLSGVPNFAGTWNGTVSSSFGHSRTYPASLVIRQTSARMVVELRTPNSRSYSHLAMVCASPGPDQGLQYLYANRPNEGAEPAMQRHGGTAYLQLSRDGRTLIGGYQNDRFRSTHGTLHFVRGDSEPRGAVA